MQKCFSKAQGISKLTRLSSILITIGMLSSSNIAYADINGIPFNPDFPNAEYPYAQAPDACSGVTNRPDSNGEIRDTWGPVDFRGACNTHDKCYYTVGSNWNTCNERLYSDLRAACERDLKVSFNVPAPTLSDPLRTRRVDGPPDPVRLAACYTIASGYYAGVQGGVALGVFDKAQDRQRRYESWVSVIRNPNEAQQKITSFYKDFLSRDPESGVIESRMNALLNGRTLEQQRTDIAFSDEVRQKITSFYKDFLSRDPESGVIESRMNALLNGRTLEQQRTDIAFSDEVRQKITGFYKQYLGRDPESGVIESRMNALLNGRTLEQQRVDIQTSPEARSRQ